MIKASKMIKVEVEKVDRIAIEEHLNHQEFEFSQIILHIWTEQNDEVELILTAHTPEQLVIKKEGINWLQPKVYKGEEE